MVTKEDLEENLNEAFDTDLEWSEMKKEDLEVLWEAADNGFLLEPLAKHKAKDYGEKKVDETIDNWTAGQLVAKLL